MFHSDIGAKACSIKGMQQVPRAEDARAALLQGLPRGLHAGVAQGSPAHRPGAASAQCPQIRAYVQVPRPHHPKAVRSMRHEAGPGDAP